MCNGIKLVGCLRIAEWRIIAPLDLLQFVVVAQREQGALNVAHLLHFTHDVFVDAIHDFLVMSKINKDEKRSKTQHQEDRRRPAQKEMARGAIKGWIMQTVVHEKRVSYRYCCHQGWLEYGGVSLASLLYLGGLDTQRRKPIMI